MRYHVINYNLQDNFLPTVGRAAKSAARVNLKA
jgi:hypothetical protein